MKGGKKAANWLGSQNKKNATMMRSLCFLLPHTSDLELKRLAPQKHKQVQISKSPHKRLLSLVKRWPKRQSVQTENICTITLLFKINTTGLGGREGGKWPTHNPDHHSQKENLEIYPHRWWMTKHPRPQSGCQRRPRRDLELSSPPNGYNPLSHTTVLAETK